MSTAMRVAKTAQEALDRLSGLADQDIARLNEEIATLQGVICSLEDDKARLTAENEALCAALNKHLPNLRKMAQQIICPADNTFSRMVADFDSAMNRKAQP